MKLYNTKDPSIRPPVSMLVYGQGGVGKTTFSSTAPKAILADCENGSKYFGLRGIEMDVALIETWADIEEYYRHVAKSDYETVVVDPIGELMEKLKTHILKTKEKKWVQYDGSLTMAGWGEMKERMRLFIKAIRDSGKHMIIIAHVEEKDDEGKIVKKPKVMTKISEELIGLVDIVGFMEVVRVPNDNGEMESKRIIRVQPSEKYESKDRTGQLGGIIEPDFAKIVAACQGTEVYAWSSNVAKAKHEEQQQTEAKELPKEDVKDEAASLMKKAKAKKVQTVGNTFEGTDTIAEDTVDDGIDNEIAGEE